MDSLGALLPFLVILGAFWLLIIRPARSKQRAALRMQQELAPGQQVMLTSGLHGTVAAIEDDAVQVEIAPGVTTRWAKPAIARILTPQVAPNGDDDLDEPEGTAGTESTGQR